MNQDVFVSLVGLWEVHGVLDPRNGNRMQLRHLPPSLRGLVTRGLKVRLFKTPTPYIIFAHDGCNEFWIQCKTRGRVVIRAKGELDAGSGSYEVLKMEPNATGRPSIVWNCLRRGDVQHHIEWRKVEGDTVTLGEVRVPQVPKKLLRHKTVARCQCGNKRCLDGIEGNPGTVKISKQHITQKSLQSGAQRTRDSVALKRARMEAHWACFSPSKNVSDLRIGQHHMHPFALKAFRRLNLEQPTKTRFSSFVLDPARVHAFVKSEDHKYFHFFSGGCMPKLNFPPSLHPRNPVAVANACEALDTAQQEAEAIATNAVRRLSEQLEHVKRTERATEPRVEHKHIGTACNTSPHRLFFTAAYHCGPRHRPKALKECTMAYFFGMPNVFKDAVKFLTTLHDDLEEEHSVNDRAESLTPFEQCLLTKSYVWCHRAMHGRSGDAHSARS